MPRDLDEDVEVACRKFMRLYGVQTGDRRAAILAFLHLIDDPAELKVDLYIDESGRMKLVLEVAPTIMD